MPHRCVTVAHGIRGAGHRVPGQRGRTVRMGCASSRTKAQSLTGLAGSGSHDMFSRMPRELKNVRVKTCGNRWIGSAPRLLPCLFLHCHPTRSARGWHLTRRANSDNRYAVHEVLRCGRSRNAQCARSVQVAMLGKKAGFGAAAPRSFESGASLMVCRRVRVHAPSSRSGKFFSGGFYEKNSSGRVTCADGCDPGESRHALRLRWLL